MWLIELQNRALVLFPGKDIPNYAILSHRWEDDEVSYQDFVNGTVQERKGFRKLDLFCKQVMQNEQDVEYVWMDTCCIDKTNNSELSEAINSMYRWYQNARVCYAYLADVFDLSMPEFAKSTWFSRGWTLQELLAPHTMEFFNFNWDSLGTKESLKHTITDRTGIPADALEVFKPGLGQYSVAQRMTWAAERETTREEDLAYCLLGIFNINMPLIYGEGARAFLRLQEEILKISDDLTIFAWAKAPESTVSLYENFDHLSSVFASSAAAFKSGHPHLSKLNYEQVAFARPPDITTSGSGLTITLFLIPYFMHLYIAPIGEVEWYSPKTTAPTRMIVAMYIHLNDTHSIYQRVLNKGEALVWKTYQSINLFAGEIRRITLKRAPYYLTWRSIAPKYGFSILSIDQNIPKLFQTANFDSHRQIEIFKRSHSYSSLYMEEGHVGVAGIIRFTSRRSIPVFLHLGFDFEFNPFCLLSRPNTTKCGLYPLDESQLSVPKVGIYDTPIASNAGVLAIVAAIRDRRPVDLSWKDDRVELHLSTGRGHDVEFLLLNKSIKINMDKNPHHTTTRTYRVTIDLVARQRKYTWSHRHEPQIQASSSNYDTDVWFCEPV